MTDRDVDDALMLYLHQAASTRGSFKENLPKRDRVVFVRVC